MRVPRALLPVAGLAAILAAAAVFGETMTPKAVEEKEFSVVGIEVRTNNAREVTPDGAIPKQWERFFKENALQRIPNKADAAILAVYTDHQSDRNGEYTYILGARVSAISDVPAGMVARKVPAARYAVVATEKGSVGKVVAEAWQRIWRLEDRSGLGGLRTYRADFEVYDQRSQDPQNSQVDIYVGIK